LGKIQIRRWRCFFPEHLILNFFRLKIEVKVDLLKLTLKLVIPHNYFQILGQKNSKSFYLENIKVWTILVQSACLASCDCVVVQFACLASWGTKTTDSLWWWWVGWGG
jgi:hypothetical protein